MGAGGERIVSAAAVGPARRARAVALTFTLSGAVLLTPVWSGAKPEKVYRIG